MEEDFKFQREFSSTLLDQMKNVLAQITCLIEILNHLLTDNVSFQFNGKAFRKL